MHPCPIAPFGMEPVRQTLCAREQHLHSRLQLRVSPVANPYATRQKHGTERGYPWIPGGTEGSKVTGRFGEHW